MTGFRCTRFPEGVASIRTTEGIVRFEDGKAEVADPKLIKALGQVPEVFGVVEDKPPSRTGPKSKS